VGPLGLASSLIHQLYAETQRVQLTPAGILIRQGGEEPVVDLCYQRECARKGLRSTTGDTR